MAKKLKNILFDWSGVVNDNIACHHFAVNYIFKACGKPIMSLEEYKQKWIIPYTEFYRRYIPELELEKQRQLYKEALAEFGPTKSYPGMVELVKKIKENNLSLLVITMDYAEHLNQQLKDWDLENIFLETITALTDKNQAVKDCLAKYNFNPEQTLFIGDTNHEIEVARAQGIKSCGVTWGSYDRDRLVKAQPDYLADTPQQLSSIILN